MLIRKLSSVRMAVEQVAALGTAWLIAESLYKFGSFTLELAAFLGTWFVIDWIVQIISARFSTAKSADT